MSVSSAGWSSGTNSTQLLEQLEQQLKDDQNTLARDEKDKASQQALMMDQARIMADETAIAEATGQSKPGQSQAAQQYTSNGTYTGSSGSSTNAGTHASIDIWA